MKFLIVVCCLMAVAMAARDPDWESFKSKFNRKYKSLTEEAFRKKIFLNNKMIIDNHNQRHAEGKVTFTLGVNQFADLTTQEFSEMMNGYKVPASALKKGTLPYVEPPQATATDLDWRSSGCVTGVKDQGQCGSCWSFSTTGSTEFYNCRNRGYLVSLSEQNLVDCTYAYGNGGCNGGWMDSAFQYIINNGGVDTEDSYPYEAQGTSDGNCRFNPGNIGGTLNGYTDSPSYDENALLNNLAANGVISVAIDASHESFQLYQSGTYYEPLCDPNYLDHAVLVVGYGSDGSGDYWLVKNSWGTGWGIAGYIQMARNRNNNCGIASAASWPRN